MAAQQKVGCIFDFDRVGSQKFLLLEIISKKIFFVIFCGLYIVQQTAYFLQSFANLSLISAAQKSVNRVKCYSTSTKCAQTT